MPTYLRDLDMALVWSEFDDIGLQRIVQLINKTINSISPRDASPRTRFAR